MLVLSPLNGSYEVVVDRVLRKCYPGFFSSVKLLCTMPGIFIGAWHLFLEHCSCSFHRTDIVVHAARLCWVVE